MRYLFCAGTILLLLLFCIETRGQRREAFRDSILSKTSVVELAPGDEYGIGEGISFEDNPLVCRLTTEQFEMLGVPLWYDKEAYQEFGLLGRLRLSDDFYSLLVRYNTEHELFVDLINLDRDWNYIAAYNVFYDEIAEGWQRTSSTITTDYILTTQIQIGESCRMSAYSIGKDGKFNEHRNNHKNYDLMGGYKLHESQCELQGGRMVYLFAYSGDMDTYVIEQGLYEGKEAITQFTGIASPYYFGLITSQDPPGTPSVISLYDKQAHTDAFVGIDYLFAHFHDDLLLCYNGNILFNPDACLTLLDLNRHKCRLIPPGEFFPGQDQLPPNWFSSVSIGRVTDDTVELSSNAGKGVVEVTINRNEMEPWSPEPPEIPVYIEEGEPKIEIRYVPTDGKEQFVCTSCVQPTEKLPQWVMPIVESSHSILEQDKEILNRDFSPILADNRISFIGYMGENYQKMDITFQKVEKETAMRYLIAGSSDVSNNNCVFSGTLDIEDVREQNEYEYGVDDLMKEQIHKQGVCIARYNLKVEDCGTFSGISVFRWYIDNNNKLCYDDINESSDSYSNNLFAGTWQSNTGDQTVKCAWGQYRIPDCGDLDIGAAEFSVNPIYAGNGWESRKY